MSQLFVDDVVSKEGTNSVGFSKGISVSVASTFSGDVSIGGTLTYEDVTNVDVVGLITARGGIKLGAAGIGGTFNANGDTTLAGVVTATSFVGSGANLTSLPAGQLTGTVADARLTTVSSSKLSGALPALDGSALTGIGNTANVSTSGLNVVGVATIGGDVSIADKIIHTGDTNTAIRFPAADTISFETSGGEQLRVSSGGQILGGLTTPYSTVLSSQTPKIQLESTSVSGSSMFLLRDGADAGGPFLFLGHGRGGTTIVQDDDELGAITFVGADGTNFQNAAAVKSFVDGTPGSGTDMPGRLSFWTSPDGSTTMAERLRIGSSGQFGIAGANYGTAGQVLSSQGASAAPQWATAAGGLTEVDAWTLTGSWPYPQSTWSNARLGNNSGETGTGTLARNTENNMPLGTGMTNTNGLFTFPSSGTWQVDCQLYLERYSSAVCEGLQVSLSGDKDGSSGSLMSVEQDINQYVNHSVINLTGIIKFTNTATTNFYVKLTAATQVYIKALSASQNIIFKKLA